MEQNYNPEEIEIEIKGKGRWFLKVCIDDYEDALVFSELEGVPAPSESFDDYPVIIDIPQKTNIIKILYKAIQYSRKGIFTRAYRE